MGYLKTAVAGLAFLLAAVACGKAQEAAGVSASDEVVAGLPSGEPAVIQTRLPDSPGAGAVQAWSSSTDLTEGVAPGLAAAGLVAADGRGWSAAPPMAGRFDKYIAPGQPVPKISAGDKFVLGVRDAVSLFSFSAWVADAGYEQLVDSSPNYGHNRIAFGQRFGAGVARDISEGVLGDSILAPLFHEDPRYYKMGPGHAPLARIVYAGSRALITKTDGGRRSFNFAQVLGNLGGAVLTKTYYPEQNRTFSQVTETFAGSVGGSALGFVVSEYMSDFLVILHLQHPK